MSCTASECLAADHVHLPDYVIVVFAIFAIFIGAYWLVSGKSFVGPVSPSPTTEAMLSCSKILTDHSCQQDFERLIGSGNHGVLEATSSVAENGRGDSEEGRSEKNRQAPATA